MQRIYTSLVKEHLEQDQQMLFLAGPRQVGKTTISRSVEILGIETHYFNWDVQEHRQLITQGPIKLSQELNLPLARKRLPIVIFDEIHKYSSWKNYLKGFYDLFHTKLHIIVTGSAKLDIYKGGGDSLMGRYFLYRIHPLSVAELIRTAASESLIQAQHNLNLEKYKNLLQFGGFPAPFAKHSSQFYRRWKTLRNKQLFHEDIRDITHIHEINRLELLAELLRMQIGQLLNRSALASKINSTVSSVNRWLEVLERVYYCFSITPWHKNISRSLIKEPKIYLWDWSLVEDIGSRAENFIASHLLKAVHYWNDRGMGEFNLHFIRDKDKNEVDFLVVKDKDPWFLVEVKQGKNHRISDSLIKFQKQLNTPFAFQVVIDLPYLDVDCFCLREPAIVPAITFLSQLV